MDGLTRTRASRRHCGWHIGGSGMAQTTYGVFCANGRIEIDSRSEEQMRRQRGACQFARFPFRMDAESFARKNFKAVGASAAAGSVVRHSSADCHEPAGMPISAYPCQRKNAQGGAHGCIHG